MGKRGIYALVIGLMLYLCGCGTLKPEGEVAQNESQVVEEIQEEKELRGEEESGQSSASKESLWQEDQQASTILEDEGFLYFCGKSNILKVEKGTGQAEYIWGGRSDNEFGDMFEYSGTKGILAGEYLYFVEEWTEEADMFLKRTLSVIKTDGSGYKQLVTMDLDLVSEKRLVLLDGILYFVMNTETHIMTGYPLGGDGMLLEGEKVETKIEGIPSGYAEVYYRENGSRALTALESEKKYGYYLLRDEEYKLYMVDPATGEKREFPAELNEYAFEALNDDSFLFSDYANDKIYLMDAETAQYEFLADTEEYFNVIDMDETYIYYQNELIGDDFCQYQYCRMEIASGQWEELFVIDAFDGASVSSPWYSMDVSVLDNYIYYVGEWDYKLYLMRRDVDMPGAEEILGDAIYDSRISEVGSLKTYREEINSKIEPEVVAGSLDLEWLVVDEKFSGAEKINQYLEAEQNANIEYLRDNAQDYDEWLDYDIPGFSFSSNVSPIYYMDGRYLSFTQENYDYTGGAHGMPYWICYTFDLETGNELMLSDIVAEDEETLKEIVTRYFTEIYNENPDEYWDDAVEVVNENTSLQSPFYLSNDGIVFYYGPYELAPYAGGFKEVVVPYSEIDLKIDLQ